MTWLRRNWEIVTAVALLWAASAGYFAISFAAADGHLIYGLDDPYIHMATAKNLVEHGTWGVTRYGFSSSQSSLLWPLLLALTYLPAGPFEAAPLMLNLLFATALVAYLVVALKRFGLPGGLIILLVVELILLMPVPLTEIYGIEHVLQAFVGLVFLDLAVRALAGQPPPPRNALALVALAPIIVAVRFEGAFLIAVTAVLFLARRRWRPALALPALAAAPIVIYGVISVAHGAFWLPNSVLLKNNALSFSAYPSLAAQLTQSVTFGLLVLGALLYYLRRRRGTGFWEAGQLSLVMVSGACLLQLVVANLTTRYEAHLIPLGLYALGLLLNAAVREAPDLSARARQWLPIGALIAVLLLPGSRHQLWVSAIAYRSSQNIYQQQYQMSRFIGRYYRHAAVAANDIGMITYFNDIKVFDLWGLADNEVARARMRRNYGPDTIRRIAQRDGVKIAIAYPSWWSGRLPPEWKLIGSWTVPSNVACAEPTVAFWAVAPAEIPALRRHLIEFGPRLPRSVKWRLGEPRASTAWPAP